MLSPCAFSVVNDGQKTKYYQADMALALNRCGRSRLPDWTSRPASQVAPCALASCSAANTDTFQGAPVFSLIHHCCLPRAGKAVLALLVAKVSQSEQPPRGFSACQLALLPHFPLRSNPSSLFPSLIQFTPSLICLNRVNSAFHL